MGELEGNDPQPICGLPEEIEKAPENAGKLVAFLAFHVGAESRNPHVKSQEVTEMKSLAVSLWDQIRKLEH